MLMKFVTLLCLAVATMGFVPAATRRKHGYLSMALMTPPPPVSHVVMDTSTITSPQSPLTQGIDKFMGSSHLVALQERKVPTAEEVAAKKRNFNLWFWGGGIVAPFLATFYYFGFKFWEK
jgi:hypothetical protein